MKAFSSQCIPRRLRSYCLALLPTLVVGNSFAAFCLQAIPGVRPLSSSLLRPTTLVRGNLNTDDTAATYNTDELPVDLPRRDDVLIALAAVRRACQAIVPLQPIGGSDVNENEKVLDVVAKADMSPVTVADFTAQAIVLHYLHEQFPADSFIAEESSAALQQDAALVEQVLQATGLPSIQIVKDSIDLGQQYNDWSATTTNNPRPGRVWCLDPIDGTKGFLRGRRNGGQYCVALALLENGIPVVGVLGCPNLPASSDDFDYAWSDEETFETNQNSRGCIFVASRNGGCYQLSYRQGASPAVRLHVTPNNGSTLTPRKARFCVGVEKFSDALGQCANMAQILHGPAGVLPTGEIVLARRIDSQAKYGILARGGAEYYVRLPRPGYREWIWDHAAGNVVITEAGGVMTDTEGRDIDFSLGAKMSDQVKGVLGSNGGIFHDALVKAYAKQEIDRLKTVK